MSLIDPTDVRRIACVGAGVISGGWAAYFLAYGYEVAVYSPFPSEENKLNRLINAAWPSLKELLAIDSSSREQLYFTTDLRSALDGVDFVQESAPENLGLKQQLYAEMDKLTASQIVIASRTSGLSMSDIQSLCSNPGRTVVAHPINPPYLMPLVEVVGGTGTDPETVDWTVAFYQGNGKRVLRLDQELPGFIACRLQEAVWREALHMVAREDATVEQIDCAMKNGLGPRWATMGPCLTFHLGGGEGGMAHTLDQFGPTLKLPWTHLKAPKLTKELRNRMVQGCEREAAGRTHEELVSKRDSCLVAIMKALESCQSD